MRFVRLAALFLGVGLIVAVTAGYVARNMELARDRDLRVATAAEVAAIDVRSIVNRVGAVAELATEPARAVEVLDGLGALVCASARDVGAAVCGDGDAEMSTAEMLRAALGPPGAASGISVDGDSVVVVGAGPTVAVAAALPLADIVQPTTLGNATSDRVTIDVVPFVATEGSIGVTTDGDRRVAYQTVPNAPAWAVVASVPAAVELDGAERLAMVILLVLAVLLLCLAGFTFVAEHRSLRERATIDPLTQLPNRSEFETRGTAIIQNALRGGDGVCLMLVDLDGFKEINDTHGHHAGDEVLQVVGKRLRAAVRGYDVVARWGGDEFVLVLPGIDNERFATSRATSLTRLVGEPMRTADAGGNGLRVGASIGIALLGQHGDTLDELVEAADVAMYTAKRRGETFRIADPATPARSEPELSAQPS